MALKKLNSLFMGLIFASIVTNFVIWWTLGSYIISSYVTSVVLPVIETNSGATYAMVSVLFIGTNYCSNCFNKKNKFGV